MSRFLILYILSLAILSANSAISAYRVSDEVNLSSLKDDDDIWRYAKNTKVILYPQTTLLMSDKRANRLQRQSGAEIARASSLYNSSHISIKLKWRDINRTLPHTRGSDIYDDAFAVEIPIDYEDPKRLPYIGMGSKGRAVEVYYGSLSAQRDRGFVAEGFRGIVDDIKRDEFNISIRYDGNSSWIGVLTKPLKDRHVDLNQSGTLPIAFAIWRGDRLNRAELKHISGWTPLDLQKKESNETLKSELTYIAKGSLKIGRAVALDKCSLCHVLEENSTTMRYIAPELSNIGGYATKAYILESISDPDAVIVDGYNPKAYPKFLWYNIDENGTKHSNMPTVVLDENSTKHLLRYLMSLKSSPTKGN